MYTHTHTHNVVLLMWDSLTQIRFHIELAHTHTHTHTHTHNVVLLGWDSLTQKSGSTLSLPKIALCTCREISTGVAEKAIKVTT